MIKKPIYLDYMATTPVDPQVVHAMLGYLGLDGHFGNPASVQHDYGQQAARAVEQARNQIASVVGATAEDIIFTSGATESNNLAILGAARFYQRKGRHVITMTTEHKAVLDTMQQLEREGFCVTYLSPQSDGCLNLQQLEEAIRADTVLVSIMHVNNEIGVIQDIAAIGELLHGRGIVFHVDAAQSVGKVSIDLSKLSVDLMSLSAHKAYGPKGIGALYVRHKPRIRLQPQSFGGGHEHGLRSGTLATHQIVGMGEAFALAESLREAEQAHILALRQILWQGIRNISGIHLNGHEHQRVAGNLHVSFQQVDGAMLLPALHEIAVSTTSACQAASGQSSHVLTALGLSHANARASIRISLGRFTTLDEIHETIQIINQAIQRIQYE